MIIQHPRSGKDYSRDETADNNEHKSYTFTDEQLVWLLGLVVIIGESLIASVRSRCGQVLISLPTEAHQSKVGRSPQSYSSISFVDIQSIDLPGQPQPLLGIILASSEKLRQCPSVTPHGPAGILMQGRTYWRPKESFCGVVLD